MKNLKFPLFGITLFVLVLSWVPIQHFHSTVNLQAADPVATHNMLVVGEKTIYLSHLPMFQQKGGPLMPHRYQVILEVGFEKQGSNPGGDYGKDRQVHTDTKIYTINPEEFILPRLVTDPKDHPLSKFKGTIFRGHLEKGGSPILTDIDVNVKRVVYFKKFDAVAKHPSQLEYLLFGKGDELFIAHLIVSPPDFDQVMSIKLSGHSFTDDELAKGIRVTFGGTKNISSSRLKENQQAEAGIVFESVSAPEKIHVSVIREFYFEEGELQMPSDFESTVEEKTSGFL